MTEQEDKAQIVNLLKEQVTLLASINERLAAIQSSGATAHAAPSAPRGSYGAGTGGSGSGSAGAARADSAPDTTTTRGNWCTYKMPFGKHFGMSLDKCPKSYLTYFIQQCRNDEMRDGDFKDAIINYIACREATKAANPGTDDAAATLPSPAKTAKPHATAPKDDDDVPF